MRGQIVIACALLTCLPVLAQNSQDENEIEPDNPLQQVRMMVPPPVSGLAYATLVGTEQRSNYLRAGATFSGGYVRNLEPGSSADVNEATYLVQPTLSFDRTATRLHSNLTYNPSFTWFQAPTAVRTTDQSLSGDLQWRIAKYVSFRAGENFLKASSAYGQALPSYQPSVGGSTQFASPEIVSLYEPQISNQSTVGITWQYGRNDMVAGSGWVNIVNFTNPAEAGGFYNTNTRGGSGSWTHRLGEQQYIGALYQYAWTQADPVSATETGSSQAQVDNTFGFYTVYLTARTSLSLQGGGQYATLIEHPTYPDYRGWKPGGNVSLGWQGDHTNLAVSFSRLVTSGGGLLDAFTTNSVDGSARWRITPTWTIDLGGHYSNISNLLSNTWPGAIGQGHTASGNVSLEHQVIPGMLLSCSYVRLHQNWSYTANPAPGSSNPDSDRVLVSLTYLLSRPIGQ